jgi:hypothetical protein
MGRWENELMPGFQAIPRPAVSHSVFLCERHQFLTGNPIFQNNLMHALFKHEPA